MLTFVNKIAVVMIFYKKLLTTFVKPILRDLICTFQETLATLNLGAPGSELSERNKRTIGILRQLFPTLTQV